MSEINIRVEPGQIIDVGGKQYEAVAFRCPREGELWLTVGSSDTVNNGYYSQPHLILRPLLTRKVPTDQDAAVWPRLSCLVSDFQNNQWQASTLVGVLSRGEFRFLTVDEYAGYRAWRYCEIEVGE